ncbi:MAG: SMI1/KNR4 family protein [Planctomycetes bacterium]|nr:SMI1/KNR4 family protein [Planctomycetota bacterium]MCB9824460.1 SMI1/KNR4 family protein [Planctomycetota bacterium]MCB9830458.1 SMI1/KNR4 family protein [Planctomycetota bacterium]MCB9900457.1 SMI1/KNR4 family protein [Planctomycetota bacterium]
MRLDDLLGASGITTCAPASPAAIAEAERDLGVRLPHGYRDLLLRFNGLEGFVGPESCYLVLHPIEFVGSHQYEPNIVPGLIVVGSDGGGEAFGFLQEESGGSLFARVPFIGDGLASMDRLATTFEGFIERIRLGDFG